MEITDVHAFGPDAVTITDISVVQNDLAVETRRGDLLDLEDLLKRPVMTESGTRLGHVGAIQFGDASHRLTAIDVVATGSGEQSRIPADEIQAIGDELIIVADPSAVTAADKAPRARGAACRDRSAVWRRWRSPRPGRHWRVRVDEDTAGVSAGDRLFVTFTRGPVGGADGKRGRTIPATAEGGPGDPQIIGLVLTGSGAKDSAVMPPTRRAPGAWNEASRGLPHGVL